MSRKPHFLNLEKQAVRDLLACDSPRIELVPVPRNFFHSTKPGVAKVVAESVRAIEVDKELVPFLCCSACQSLFTWYKWDSCRGDWFNQSGIASIRNHVTSCRRQWAREMSAENSSAVIDPPPKPPGLSPQHLEELARRVGDLLCEHPTVPVTVAADLVCCGAQFAGDLTFKAKQRFIFRLPDVALRDHLERSGDEARHALLAHFQAMRRNPNCNVALATDGTALLACGLSERWEWVRFPLQLDSDLLASEEPPERPLFVCAEEQLAESLSAGCVVQCGCCERVMARAMEQAMDGTKDSKLRAVVESIAAVEKASLRLPEMPSQLPSARPWTCCAIRLSNLIASYPELLQRKDLRCLPPLLHLQELQFVIEEVKKILDMLQADGPTAHLPFLLFLQLDVTLQRIKLGLEARAASSMMQRLALCLQEFIGSVVNDNKGMGSEGSVVPTFYALSSAGCRLTATFLTGIDLPAKVRQVTGFEAPGPRHEEHHRWQTDWIATADAIEQQVLEFAGALSLALGSPSTCKLEPKEALSPQEASDSASSFHANLFAPSDMIAEAPAEFEWPQYNRNKTPTEDPVQFWKNANDLPGLQKLARFVFSIPTSSLDCLSKEKDVQLETNSEIVSHALFIKHVKRLQLLPRSFVM